jgi:2'-5' RNA ligase
MKKTPNRDKSRISVISALCRVLAAGSEIVAWDYPPRPYKKAVEAILAKLKEYGIEGSPTAAEWPHFTVEFVPPLDRDDKEKIKMMAPALSTRLRTGDMKILEGKRFPVDFIVWELEPADREKLIRLRQEIREMTGSKPLFSDEDWTPHVSLVTVPQEYREKLNEIKPELYDAAKKFKTSYEPEQLQLWGDMNIYDIEEMKFK